MAGPDYALRSADRLGSLLELQRQSLVVQGQIAVAIAALASSPPAITVEMPEPPESVVAPHTDELLRQVLVALDRLAVLAAAPRRHVLVTDGAGKPVSSVEELVGGPPFPGAG